MRIRSILLAVLAAFALVGVLAASLLAAVSLGWQRERLRGWLETRIAQEIGAQVTIGALDGALHRTFVLRDVSVIAGSERPLAVSRAAVTVGEVEVWPRPRLVLSALELDGAELRVRRDAEGRWSLEGLGSPEGPDSASDPVPESAEAVPWLEIRRVEARDVGLSVALGPAAGDAVLAGRYAVEARDLAFPPAGLPSFAFDGGLEPGPTPLGAIEGGALRGRVSGDGLELAEARIDGSGFTLDGRGVVTSTGLDAVQIALQVDDLARVTGTDRADLAARGALAARGGLRGPWDRLGGELVITGRALALRGVVLGDLEASIRAPGDGSVVLDTLRLSGGSHPLRADPGARLRLDGGAVAVEGLRLASGDARVAIDGGLGPEGFAGLDVQAQDIDPAPFATLAGATRPVGGRLAGELRLDGPFAHPVANGVLRWSEPRFGELRFDVLEVELETRGDLVAARFGLDADGTPALRGRAEIPRRLPSTLAALLEAPGLALDLELRPLAIRRIEPLLPESTRSLDGRIEGALALRGGSPWPVIRSATLIARDVARPGETPRDLDLAFASRPDGAIEVETLRLVQGDRRLAAKPGGRLRPAPNGVVVEALTLGVDGQLIELSGGIATRGFEALRLRTRGYDPASLAALLGVGEPVAGRLDVDLELAGAYDAPSVHGQLELAEARVGDVRFDRLELSVATADDRIRAAGTLQRDGRKLFDLEASVPRERARLWPEGRFAAEAVELTLEADDLELALFAPLLPATLRDPVGTVRGRLRLRQGRAGGSIELAAGGIRAPGLGRLEPIVARLEIDGDALVIQRFRVGSAAGDARLTGRIGLAGLRPASADLELLLDRFAVAQPGLWSGRLSGRVDAVGPLAALRTQGDLTFGALRVEVPRTEDPTLNEIRIVTADAGDTAPREGAAPGFLEGATVDLRLEVPENSWIRGGGAELEVAGTLRLTKRPLAPLRYAGSLRVVRGSYRLHGKRFELRRGSATLLADPELDPDLDVKAVHRVSDVEIVAHVTGRASAPEVQLSSEPPLPDADVLSYLLFGRSAAELAGGQQAALAAAATQAAAGIAAGELQRLLTDVTPVDTVDIRIREDGSPGELGVGKYLGDRIFIRYGRSLGVEAEDRVGVEVELTPSWSLESDVSSSGSAGVDLIWSRDY